LQINKQLIAAGALKSKAKAAQIRPVNFDDETKFVNSILTKSEIQKVQLLTRRKVWEELKDTTISKANLFIEQRQKEREMDLLRVEFEMASAYGSRISQWEYCYDRPNEKYVYINTDTLEVIHAKTAICEKCDSIFEQSEKKCKLCDSSRSAKNTALYRPLGFKDIRID